MFSALRSDFLRGSALQLNSEVARQPLFSIPPLWKRDSHCFNNWVHPDIRLVISYSARRQPICRARPVEETSENPTEREDPKISDHASRFQGSGRIGEGTSTSSISASTDSGWLPALPHVLMATISNVLFGYHIGIMNGPIISIAHELGFEDRIGRRRTLQLDMLPLIVGTLISAQANSVNEMILGRFLVGLGIGANTVLVPVYISEVSPTKYRGSFGAICSLATSVGIIVALVLGIPCEKDPHWWRTMFYVASVPGILLIIGMQFAAESPRWLGKMGKWKEAKTIISQLWGNSQVKSAIEELTGINNLDGNCEEANWSELLTKRHFKAPAIGGTLFILQQFAGINGVLYFSSLTFGDVGITNTIAASLAVGIANFSGAIVALYLMDKQGRRNLLLGSYIGMASSMFLLVIAFGAPMDEEMHHFLSVFGTLIYVSAFSLGAGPVTGLIIPELSSTRTRAKTMSFSLCVHWVCNFIIGLFFLDVVEKFGLPIIYSSFGIVSLLAAAFTYYCVIETKGHSLEEIEFLLNPDLEPRD